MLTYRIYLILFIIPYLIYFNMSKIYIVNVNVTFNGIQTFSK